MPDASVLPPDRGASSGPASPAWVAGEQAAALKAIGVRGLPEVRPGDDLAGLVLSALAADGEALRAGDVLVISSKVVSKAAGLAVTAVGRDDVVAAESRRLVAQRRTPRGLSQVVQSAAGPVMAAAGVDASNTAPGTVLTLPRDPDAAARELRSRLRSAGAPRVAVVVSDTAGRAWRRGQVDFALGCAGLVVVDDLRGTTDASGQVLEVTERVVADEVAALADLVKGKTAGIPAAVVRGLAAWVTEDDGPGAACLLRDPSSDWFRLGHVEAVRAALGSAPGSVEAPSVLPEPVGHRAARAAAVALWEVRELSEVPSYRVAEVAGATCVTVSVSDAFAAGVCASRLRTALWAEDLLADVRFDAAALTLEVDVPPA